MCERLMLFFCRRGGPGSLLELGGGGGGDHEWAARIRPSLHTFLCCLLCLISQIKHKPAGQSFALLVAGLPAPSTAGAPQR